MSNQYLGKVDGVMNFYCVRPDHSESVRDEHVLRKDYDALRTEFAQLAKVAAHAGESVVYARAEVARLREQLAAANERAGKLNRQLVELQDAIDSRDKAAGFAEVDEITFPGRTDDTGVPMP